MADLVLESGVAVLKESGKNTLVFPFTQKGTKTLKDAADAVDTQWVYRSERSVNFANNGVGTLTVSSNTAHTGGTDALNDTGSLTATDRRNFIIVSKSAATSAGKTGTISTYTGNTITGSGTNFDGDFVVGDYITFTHGANTITERITEITNDTTIKVANTFTVTGTSVGTAPRASYPAGTIFDLSSNGSISASGTSASINLGRKFLGTFSASVSFDMSRTDAVQTAKTVEKNKYVWINTGDHSASKNGPWSLGVSDAYKIEAVYIGGNTTVTTSNDNIEYFELDTGQKDALYDTSYLKLRDTASLDLTNRGILVKFNYFGRDRSGGIGYLSVDSYPVDDTNIANTTAVATAEIPRFVSPTTGKFYDLRDSIDFRPTKSNSITPSANATLVQTPSIKNPSASTTFDIDSDGVHMPTPDQNFQCDAQFYLPRKDRIIMTSDGVLQVIKGVPSLKPKTPSEPAQSMTLGALDIPVYPSLSPYAGKVYKRPDYTVKLSLENNRRYTMKDLRGVEERIKNLEYYTSLSALEASAQNKQLFGPTGVERFKNGLLVDNFDGHNLADTTQVGYRAAIDRNRNELRPTFKRSDISFTKDLTLSS
ncbi:MAG: DUF4815 domain-containing protein, partial [Candidatus Poseidoniales archaeon]